MPDISGGFPAIFVLFFVVVIGVILFGVVKGVSQWSYSNAQPVQSLPAEMVTKPTDMSGGSMNSTGRVNTLYYATFDVEGGQRQEFSVSGHEYGLLAEGDRGTLTFQGTRYKGFARG